MSNWKKIALAIFVIAMIIAAREIYVVNINHNFETITEGKVYKSGVIPPDQLEEYIKKNNIKSVVDLRFPGTGDDVNNPEVPEELIAEREAIAKLQGVNYFNNGSDQVPSQDRVDSFLKIMDNPDNYPVLIHCYHGIGRAELYSALYKIEYEGMDPDKARTSTRLITKWSSFDDGTPKGEYLKAYQPRPKASKE